MQTNRLAIIGLALLLLAGAGTAVVMFALNADGAETPRFELAANTDPQIEIPSKPAPAPEYVTPSGTDRPQPSQPVTPKESVKPNTEDQGETQQSPLEQLTPEQQRVLATQEKLEKMTADLLARQELLGATQDFTVTISGRVTDDSGAGVAGAAVHVSHGAPASVGRTPRGESDVVRMFARGQVSLGKVATADQSGNYEAVLKFKIREGQTQVDLAITAQSQGLTCPEATSLTGVSNEEQRAGVDVRMEAAGSLRGRVVDSSGQPVAGITVYAHITRNVQEGERTRRLPSSPLTLQQAVTDRGGAFHITNLQAGTWTLTATGTKHVADGPPVTVAVQSGSESVVPQDIVVKASASLKLRLLTADGEPLPRNGRRTLIARLLAQLPGGGTALAMGAVDENGFVTFDRVRQDAQSYSIQVQGYAKSGPHYFSIMDSQTNDGGEIRLTAE